MSEFKILKQSCTFLNVHMVPILLFAGDYFVSWPHACSHTAVYTRDSSYLGAVTMTSTDVMPYQLYSTG